MSFLMRLYGQAKPKNFLLVSCYSTLTSDLVCLTAQRQLLQFLFSIIFFHCSEYFLALAFHGRDSVNFNSLLISKSYAVAMLCALLEYSLEAHFFPGMKQHWLISNAGLAMVVLGELIRKAAIITAGRSFTHLIRRNHEEHHKLVTHGIYAFVRHPSYCGFLIWAVGTQVMLCNPLSTVAFAIVVWQFFRDRIPYEEFFLRRFFEGEYDEYARHTPSGVPFIR
ncbi:protein-S-isoprenylcysteine O-methyltransferase A-like isoform X3 [Andrographis paniculata]|uniref:protein-S-isoprenylcysteine O-methyltransferase A-like isoform X3 n=1 Tax=Andrographis paniculata TaxID=175694 RepID=UPI0021E70F4B|nr:protein-S-isoprenylcysteine O-methyltransferase A-like isoform X3 [Andrographis paniculata]